jgi:hypothetical protein
MSPELFITYIEQHSDLVEKLNHINDVFKNVAYKILSISKEHRSKFISTVERYVNPGFKSYYRADSAKIESIDDSYVRVIFTVDGVDGDADKEIHERFATKLFSDYYFDRPSFDKYFEEEYKEIVNKYNLDKAKREEVIKNNEREQYLKLKAKFEAAQ